jgi:hypothetical protein
MVEGIVTTKECKECHFIFSRYVDHMPDRKHQPNIWSGQERRHCPTCQTVQLVEIVRHLDEKKL